MALAKFGAIVTDIRGKLGGHIFQGNGFSTTVRTGYSGRGGFHSQNSLFQTIEGRITADWRSLSAVVREQWELLAHNHPLQTILGDSVPVSGQNFHRHLYTYFWGTLKPGYIDPALAISDLPSSELDFAHISPGIQSFDIAFVKDYSASAIMVYAMPVNSESLKIRPERLPFIYSRNSKFPLQQDLYNALFQRWPSYVAGQPLQVGVRTVNPFGFPSFIKTIYATFTLP